MTKVFSTKLDAQVIRALDAYCKENHLKKSSLLEEIISKGIKEHRETMAFAESIKRGLEDEREGRFQTIEEVEEKLFGHKRNR